VPGKRYSALDLAADANRFDSFAARKLKTNEGRPVPGELHYSDSSWHGFRKRVDKCSRMKNIA
jgi:hypothetical protein